jgi:hypothetical protein
VKDRGAERAMIRWGRRDLRQMRTFIDDRSSLRGEATSQRTVPRLASRSLSALVRRKHRLMKAAADLLLLAIPLFVVAALIFTFA